jgi:L-ascorbate metabolism protein UlaG (beta-lactamase superfamily)
MGEASEQTRGIKELYQMPLGPNESASIYMGWAGILLRRADVVVGFDIGYNMAPAAVRAIQQLDLLGITHRHGDHYVPKVIRTLLEQTQTHVVVEPEVGKKMEGKFPKDRVTVVNWREQEEPLKTGPFSVWVLPGVHPCPIAQFKVTWGKFSVFHAGDSGYWMMKKYPAKVAFLPVGLPSPTCAPGVAMAMAKDLQPQVVVAIHGPELQMQEFQALMKRELPKVEVVVPKMYQPFKITLPK